MVCYRLLSLAANPIAEEKAAHLRHGRLAEVELLSEVRTPLAGVQAELPGSRQAEKPEEPKRTDWRSPVHTSYMEMPSASSAELGLGQAGQVLEGTQVLAHSGPMVDQRQEGRYTAKQLEGLLGTVAPQVARQEVSKCLQPRMKV